MLGKMEQIGRYKILGELGRGAMGVVYRAQDPAIGRVVAIKTIRIGDLADADEQAKLHQRLTREAQSAGVLSHPGIVTIYDVAEQDGLAYISMEYVDGPTLERMMVSDPPDGRLVLDILAQTAAALDYAHKRGIVHRDIKPANIMIHERSVAKVTDFGVARVQSHQMTQAGSMIGTPNYMSPEQIQGKAVDGRSDQFSLAVIAYELLSGEKPFTGDSIPALALKIVQDDPISVHRLNRTLEWPVDTVLKRGLSKDPASRYPTCSDFVVALENACRSSKGWKPIAPGSLQSLPTIGAAAAAPSGESSRPVRKARPIVAPSSAEPLPAPADATPLVLRWARNLALVAVIVGVLAAGTVAALRWLEDDGLQQPPVARDETAVTPSVASKPVPTAPEPQPSNTAAIPPATPSEQPTESAPPAPEPARTERPAEPKPAASMPTRLITNPPGATLVVDGNPGTTCKSPCELELPPGRHTLAATLEGYRRTLKIFEAPANSEIFLNLDRMSGTLMIRSEPRGATIIINGETRSEKTPAMITLPTGRYTVDIVQNDRRESQEVTIGESKITNLAIELPDR
jgi:serine/threonine protein kinase